MNPIERQILKNQIVIMHYVFFRGNKEIDEAIEETRELLNPNFLEKYVYGKNKKEDLK